MLGPGRARLNSNLAAHRRAGIPADLLDPERPSCPGQRLLGADAWQRLHGNPPAPGFARIRTNWRAGFQPAFGLPDT